MEAPSSEVTVLKEEIRCLQDDLTTAAESGIMLLRSNEELQEKYESDALFYQHQIEELKQENFTLSKKLYIQTSTHQAFHEELELVKGQTESFYKSKMSMMEQNHTLKVQELKWQLEKMEHEIERLQNIEVQMKEKLLLQEGTINKLKEDTPIETDTAIEDELIELQKQSSYYKHQLHEHQLIISDKTQQLNQQLDQLEVQEIRISELQQTLDERVELSNELYRGLQESQESYQILQCELEKKKLERLEEDFQSSGNSLFGEVEEQRLETERKLISLQVKYDTLERTHQMLKQHFKKLKGEMSSLLCRHGTFTADAAQVERLQRNLTQRESDIHRLTNKIYKLEEDKEDIYITTDCTNRKGLIQYLQQQIDQKEKSLCSIRKELDLSTTQLVWETTKLRDTEGKLHKSEQDKAHLINDCTKMRLRLTEVKEKENDFNLQLVMADKEIATLKQQLRTKLRKGHKEEEEVVTSPPPQTNTEHYIIEERVPVINLLEELEKENTIPHEYSSVDDKDLSDSHKEQTVHSPLKELTPPPPPSIKPQELSPLKVIKISQNVNQCPQQ